jgi:hypothetical protein
MVTCDTALAALPRMYPEIEESHDACISLDMARKSLREMQGILDNQLQTALLERDSSDNNSQGEDAVS